MFHHPTANSPVSPFVALCLAVGMSSAAAAHPFHSSYAEVEWNEQSGHLEVAMRVDAFDLETALRQRFHRPIDLDSTSDLDQLIVTYLQETFAIESGAGDQVEPYVWVGKELSLRAAWLYFEVPLRADPQGHKLRHRLFFEIQPTQVNQIEFGRGTRLLAISFHRETAVRPLDFSQGQRRLPR